MGRDTDRQTLLLFWRTSLRDKPQVFLAIFHSIGAICLGTLVPLTIGKMLATLVQPDPQPFGYMPWLLAAAAGGVIGNRIGFGALMKIQARGARGIQEEALTCLMARSVGFHNNNVSGKLVSDAIDIQSSYTKFAGAFFINLVPFAVVLTVGSAIVFSQSWLLGLVVTAMSALTLFAGLWDRYRRKDVREKQIAATKAVTSHLADTIVNIQTAKTFAREPHELSQHQRLGDKMMNLRLSNWLWAARSGNYRIIALVLMQIGLVTAIIQSVQHNPETLGAGIFAFSFTIMLSTRLFDINKLMKDIEDSLMDAAPMSHIMQETPEIRDKAGAERLQIDNGAITLRDVGFSYQESSDQQVFTRLNLDIKPGEKVGLVGPSGGGKSTLTRLLLRFEDVTSGEIIVDGQNIADVTQSSLRESVSYVPQEPLLFHRTIRENIAYGKMNASEYEIEQAARSAHAHEFIKILAKGYDTIVGERGVKLSGGQRQRVAIARAILKDAPILILDEATSALDSESEVLIQKALWELMKDRTAIVIAHRLSTIQRMDRIVVLDEGKITEEGSHKELLARKGTYAKLWAHQSGGFIEE